VNKHPVCWHDLLVLTKTSSKALEYNARFGDPGAQTIPPLLNSALAEIAVACVERRLHETQVEMHDKSFAVVIISA
jgi:phosphoribosylamine-glycine ligase